MPAVPFLLAAALGAFADPVSVSAAAATEATAPATEMTYEAAGAEPMLNLATHDDLVTWHGFGEWMYARTNENEYGFGNPDGNFRNVEMALAVMARPEANVSVGAQAFFAQHGEEMEPALDWAFAEWHAADWGRLRAGRIKQPIGLFFEVKDVGTVRAFLKLPTSVYHAGFGAESVDGAGVTGNVALGDWNAGYDIYGGIVSTEPNRPWIDEGSPEAEMTFGNLTGARLRADSPFGTTLMLSGYRGEHIEDGTFQAVAGFSLEQQLGSAAVRGEYFWLRHGEEFIERGWYGEAEYRLFDKWQLALRWDQHDGSFFGAPEGFESQMHHEEFAAGVSYWISPELVARLSFHAASGGRFIRAVEESGKEEMEEIAVLGEEKEAPTRASLIMSGVQFSF